LESPGIAGFNTSAAAITTLAIYSPSPLKRDCPNQAGLLTFPATKTSVLGKAYLRPGIQAFRVLTPSTTKRTPLEEDNSSDAGSIMDREALKVKNSTVCGHD